MLKFKINKSKSLTLIIGILMSVIIYYIYYFFSLLGANNQIPPVVAVWMPNLVFEEQLDVSREKAFDEFKKNNIDARVFFWPLSSLPMINKDLSASNFNSYDIASRSINLPSYHDITDSQLMRVVNVVKEIIN